MPKQRRPLGKRIFYDVMRQLARVVFSAIFQIRCRGRERFPDSGALIVCSNHQSMFDPIIVGLTCDRPMSYLARESLFKLGPFRFLIELMDAIPIQRDGMGIGGLKETLRRLKNGEIVVVFPEGTRTEDGRIGPLKPGFTALVRRRKVGILVMAMDGAHLAWPKGQALPGRRTVHIEIGELLSVDKIAETSDDELVEAVHREMNRCLKLARASRQRADSGT